MNSILPSIMQSIKPQYCELIAAGKKTIEVRKTRPKLKPPFKVYIYQSKTVYVSKNKDNEFLKPVLDKRFGKVIGEYICDEIEEIKYDNNISSYIMFYDDLKVTCLSYNELFKYGNHKMVFLWHITNLKIYDEPKELSNFYHYCGDNPDCKDCPFLYVESNEDVGTYEECCSKDEGWKPLTHPPQSWCYCEEVA